MNALRSIESRTCNGVRQLRRAHGLSQNKLAELAGVDRRTIIDIENKPGYRPNVAIALKLAELLDTTTERLFWEEAVA